LTIAISIRGRRRGSGNRRRNRRRRSARDSRCGERPAGRSSGRRPHHRSRGIFPHAQPHPVVLDLELGEAMLAHQFEDFSDLV
jgi:hypothetical protein